MRASTWAAQPQESCWTGLLSQHRGNMAPKDIAHIVQGLGSAGALNIALIKTAATDAACSPLPTNANTLQANDPTIAIAVHGKAQSAQY